MSTWMLFCGRKAEITITVPSLTKDASGKPFVIVNTELLNEFDAFKQKYIPLGSSIIKLNNLLTLWHLSHREVAPFELFGNTYICLSQEQVDHVIDWVLEMRNQVDCKGKTAFVELVDKVSVQA